MNDNQLSACELATGDARLALNLAIRNIRKGAFWDAGEALAEAKRQIEIMEIVLNTPATA